MNHKKSPDYYENYSVLSTNGIVLFRTNEEKITWYVRNNLARILESDKQTVQLTFKPKGNGSVGDPYLLDEKLNQCVCCGTREKLTSHHIIPRRYIRHFSKEIRDLAGAYDNMLLCTHDHFAYEHEARELHKQLEEEASLPTLFEDIKPIKTAGTIERYGHLISSDKKERLLQTLRIYCRKEEISAEDIGKIAALNICTIVHERSKKVIDAAENLSLFIIRWRKHFVETMRPRFLPRYYDVNRSLEELIIH